MFTENEVCKVRTPVSNLWFKAIVLEVYEDSYLVETFFPVLGKSKWTVEKENIKSQPDLKTQAPNVSARLQSELRNVIKKHSNNNNEGKK